MTDHPDLMRRHVEALFTHDARGDLVRVNEIGGAAAPRFFLGRTAHGVVRRFRCDVDHDIRQELIAASESNVVRERAFDAAIDPSPYQSILGRSGTVSRIWAGPAFSFPEELPSRTDSTCVTEENATVLHPHLSAWIGDVPLCQPMFVILVDGQAVSLCGSVRRTNEAHEAGVETAPAHRGRGHAVQAVTAWARAVRAANKVPLYSTSWTNAASRAVALKLALIHFGSDLHLT